MIRRCQRRHLVPVPRVLKKEQLDLVRNLLTVRDRFGMGTQITSLTWTGDKNDPHSWINLVNMLYGPHFSTLRSRPKTESSS